MSFEQFLNSKNSNKNIRRRGEDIKVMGLRRENVLDLTVAMPLLADYIKSENDYFERKQATHDVMESFLNGLRGSKRNVHFNALMKRAGVLEGIYQVFGGTSAEDADSGQLEGESCEWADISEQAVRHTRQQQERILCHVGKIYNVLLIKSLRRFTRREKA